MTSTIMITGGTGMLGRAVLPLLQAPERALRVLSRHPATVPDGVQHVLCDLASPTGLDAALEGVDTVLHLAGGASGDDQTTATLVSAAERAGVAHLVLISVVGADAMPIGYFAAKHRAEQAVVAAAVPHTIVRVAQVDDLLLRAVRALVKLPLVLDPGGLRAQPVDARDVAAHLAELTLAGPAGRVPDLVGPEVLCLGELARSYARSVGKRRGRLPVRVPGRVGAAYRSGANLCLDGATVAERTWAAFLEEAAAEPLDAHR